ncbi:hypothetical protein [Candidatus Foliamicus sp.]
MAAVERRSRVAFAAAMCVMPLLCAQAQTEVTEEADGSVSVSIEQERFTVPAPVAAAVRDAVRNHSDDPDALQSAIRAVIAEHAAGPDAADYATAIAALAISLSRARSASVDAVLRGAAAANPAVSVATLLTALPDLRGVPRTREDADERMVLLQATVENPSQISPVQ